VFKVIKEAQGLKVHLAQLGQRVTQEPRGNVGLLGKQDHEVYKES
jgi:hypothetical protein